MPYIGRDLNRGNYLKLDDISSSFNSSTKTFNLTVGGSAFTPGSAFSILVSVGGVIQEPESAYQVNNSEITFANAPTAQDGFFCIALGVPISIGVPGNGTVNGTQMAKPFNYDGFFYLNDANNRVGINSSIPTVALDVIGDTNISGDVNVSGILTAGTYSGPISNPSGISTFYNLRVTNNLTVEGTTSTLDTDLIGVDRVEVGANSNSIVGVAVTQSGTADLVNLFDGATKVVTIDDVGNVGLGSAIPSKKLDVVGDTLLQGQTTIAHTTSPQLIIKDSDTNSPGDYNGISFRAANNTEYGFIGSPDAGGHTFFIKTVNTVNPIRLQVNSSTRLEVGNVGVYVSSTPFYVNGGNSANFSGDVNIVDSIIHSGDTDTKIRFPANGTVTVETDGTERLRIDSSGRVRIGLGSTTEGTVDSDDLTIATTGNTGMTIRSGATSNGAIHFSDATSGVGEYAGFIDYDHNTDFFQMGTNSSRFLSADSDLVVTLGKPSFGGPSRVITYGNAGGIKKNSLTVLNATGTVTGRGAGVAVGGNTDPLGSFYAYKAGNADSAGGNVFLESVGEIAFMTSGDLTTFAPSTSSERLRITSTGSLQHTAASGISYFTGSSEYLFNSTTSCPNQGGNEARVQVNENKTRATMSINAFMNNSGGPNLTFISSRSGTIGVLGTKCNNGDMLGQIRFRGDNATVNGDLAAGGQIECRARSTPADGDTIIAGELKFYTGSGSAGSMLERLTINKDGKVGIGEESPDELLHIASTGTAKFRLTDNRTSISDGSQYGVIQFEQRDSNTPGVSVEVAALMTDTTNGATALQIKTGTPSTITERLRITSGGQVRIGNSNNLALWGQNNRLQVAGTDWNTSGITIACMSNSGSANLVMGNSKASTPGGSGGALTQDNRLAYISFVGDDGTDMNTVGAAIVAELDSNASSNSMPARLSFYTGGNQTRRMRITSDGRVLIGRDSTTSISTNAALTIQNPTNSSATRFNLINSGSSQPESTQIYSQNNDLAFVAGASERLRINSTGMAVFSGGSGNVDQVKIESNSGGTGLYLVNFRGEDAGDSSARLGVGKNNNVLMFTNASGSQISNFAIGNTDSIPLVLSTANTRRIHIRGDGRIIMGTGIPTYTNSIVHVEGSGINVETEYTLEDGTGASPQFSIFGSNSHVRIDMGTLDVAPYAGYIQARFDNDPEQTGSSNSGLEPLMLNPKGGVLGYNITDSDGMNAIGNGLIGTQGGFIMRSGRANSTTVNNASTAIKIFPGEIRSYSGSGGTGEQNQGTKYGGIAWNVLDPHNGSWGTNHNGHHCWMGMSLHSTPAQEKSNWQVQMNNDAGAGTFANIVAIQANPEGYVTTPNQPSFCAIKNSSHYYFTSGQRTTISGWTEKHDTHNDFNPSTGVFTAPIAGTYYFYVSVMQDRDGNGDFQLSVFVNSTMYVNSNDMTSSSSVTFQQTTVPCIVNLAKNDEVTFRGYNQTDTTSYIYKTSYTHCGGYLIG